MPKIEGKIKINFLKKMPKIEGKFNKI